jgi:hypothetical protein
MRIHAAPAMPHLPARLQDKVAEQRRRADCGNYFENLPYNSVSED